MVDIASITASALPVGQTQPVAAIQTAIADLSQSLQNLTRSIETNATPIALSNDGNSLTLATALGNITVALSQQLSFSEKQNLTQQLLNLIQNQKPIELTIQPGSPPTQATLFIPSTSIAATAPQAAAPVLQPLAVQPPPPLATGQNLTAIILATPAALEALPVIQQNATPQPSGVSPATPPQASPNTQTVSASIPTPQSPPIAPSVPSPEDIALQKVAQFFSSFAPTSTISAATTTTPSVIVPTPAGITEQQPASVQSPSMPAAVPTAPNTLTPILLQSAAPPPATSPLVAGQQVNIQINTILTPQQAAQNPPLATNQVTAQLVGTGTDGSLILKTQDQTVLFIKTPAAPPPPGTILVITIEPTRLPQAEPLPLPIFSGLPSLPETLAALAQNAPQLLPQILAMHIPQPTEALPGALLFLLSAFKQGDVRNWLGNNAADTLLNAGKEELLASLSRELSSSGQAVQDHNVGEWRNYPIPLYAQQQFQSLDLYVHADRNARDNKGAAGDGQRVRFLIDMQLSRLGGMQLDGFVRSKQLDMVLRSEKILPDGLHHELRSAYVNAMSAVGYTGSLNFQVGRQHWVVMQNTPRGIIT